jgi:hypothetical protein
MNRWRAPGSRSNGNEEEKLNRLFEAANSEAIEKVLTRP